MNHLRVRRLEAIVDRLAAVLRGPATYLPRRLQTAKDVIDLLEEQVEALRADTLATPLQRARLIGYLAGLARKAIETGTLAARLEMLEAVLHQRKDNELR
jgi:hypothetical protein